MSNTERKPNSRRKKLLALVLLFGFIIGSTIILFQIDLIRDLFGIEGSITFDFSKLIRIALIVLGSLISSISLVYLFFILYRKIPLSGELIEANSIYQKRKFLPQYRITHILQIKGLSHKNIKNTSKDNEAFYSKNWDIITSIAKVCDEVSYWIIKSNNSVKLFFSISGWSWFSKEKARTKANNSTLSLKAAFNNRYPSIKFENASLSDTQAMLKVIKKCEYGLLAKGIPTLKTQQTQVDRLINTFNSITEDCYYVVNLKGIRKDFETKNKSSLFLKKEGSYEFIEDYKESKKTGQSSAGIYAYAETEHGMHTILAAILSIWSGTYTFNIEKIGFSKKYHEKMQKLDPIKYIRLSNKTLSSFIHLPEKPYFTEDTDQPTFEIPSISDNKTIQEITIGNIIQNDRVLSEFSLPLSSLLFNIEIVGMIGRGKSYLVASIIEQLLNTNLGCLIFDLKGEYTEFFTNDPNVVVYTIGDPAPLGINLFDLHTNTDVQNVLALICEMLTIAGAPLSPTMLNIFESALLKITKRDEKNLETFMRCLHESSEEYTKNMKTSYSRDSIDAILNRMNFIFGGINYEVFNVYKNTLDFKYLDQGKKIILDFSEYLRRGANTASIFLVCNLLLHLLSKFASEKGITNSLRYLVILEEAMYLIPKRFNLESSASIGYSEQNFIVGRSLGIGTITIYQLWDSVSSVVHANSLTKILFRGEDVEKIRTSVNLTEDQFNYLTYLPDRHFILKSKSISRPALLKTTDFTRLKLSREDYIDIAKEKFEQKNLAQERITISLMELRKEIFEGKRISNSLSFNSTTNKKINEDKVKKSNFFNDKFWEWCINTCPVRLRFANEKSIWIKNNICKKIQNNAQKIADKLLENVDTSPLLEILNRNPEYLVIKILDHYSENVSDIEFPKILTFCTINLILNKLKVKYNLGNAWKNSTIQRIKGILKDKSISDFPVT
ncbi:MAG: DUF87 domain-containing protein [Asgard group archaeon]|nr:DUF87 domain-containing protein [Asgard group archaeon]